MGFVRLDRRENFREKARAFDCETHLVQPGLLTPPLVCASSARTFPSDMDRDPSVYDAGVMGKDVALAVFEAILRDDWIIVGANVAYDMLVMAVHAARLGVDLLPQIFRAYDEDRVYDVQIAEMLHAIAGGHLGYTPDGAAMIKPSTGKMTTRYSLEICEMLVLGRTTAKTNDEWRLRYHELDGVPIEEWPFTARQYPIDDAVNTLEIALAQVEGRNRNQHDVAKQCYAAWAMHLGAAWGFNVDIDAIDALEKRVADLRAESLETFVAADFFKLGEDGRPLVSEKTGAEKKNQAYIKSLCATAYGCVGACARCKGSKRVHGRTKCKECGGHGMITHEETCPHCDGKGKLPNPKTKRNCPDCDGSGLDLASAPVPRAEKGGIQIGRDALYESGDELLGDFAAFSEQDKIRTTYIKFLRQGHTEDRTLLPLNLRPNALVASGRGSYGDVVQQLPRGGGVRECLVARPGHVFCSCDYSSIELAAHGQSCLWLLGWSDLAEAINKGTKPHDALASQIVGVPYSEFLQKKSDNQFYRDCRQASKPVNFGFPGGMGPAKLVLQQRKNGPDTTAPNGRVYKGLRFCLLVGGEQECGVEKLAEIKIQNRTVPITPTCKRCLEIAGDLKQTWFRQWPENREYFKYISGAVDQLGYLVQHVSKRTRGGLDFCSGANTLFQGLTADGAKEALRRVCREQYIDRSSPLYGTRTVLFQHDELFVEMREDVAHDAAMRLSTVMVEAMKEYLPDVAVEAEPALMRRWYKGAEPVFENDRLVPWGPQKEMR